MSEPGISSKPSRVGPILTPCWICFLDFNLGFLLLLLLSSYTVACPQRTLPLCPSVKVSLVGSQEG